MSDNTQLKTRMTTAVEQELSPDERIIHLRKHVSQLESELAQAKIQKGAGMNLVDAVRDELAIADPVQILYSKPDRANKPVEAVMHITDWHYGEVTDSSEVDGFGAFSPEIAENRVAQLTKLILDKVETQRQGYTVNKLRIIGTADYISGGIHPELLVTNAFPEPVQAVKCGYLLGSMVMAFAPHFDEVIVDLITLDNHGRLTTKPQSSQGGLNNWSYVVAEIAKQYCVIQENVTINVHAKPSALITIGCERYLAMHGHQIKGWAGKPYYGFDRRAAMEAIKRMGVPDKAYTKLLMGHFHHGFNGDVWMLGGSLSGTSTFDHQCGRFGKPHQTGWFVHPEHGEFDWTRWWLT